MGLLVKYECECISKDGQVVAKGEFTRNLYCYSIRSPGIEAEGYFGMMEHAHDALKQYHGANHLKEVRLKVTNLITGRSRQLS